MYVFVIVGARPDAYPARDMRIQRISGFQVYKWSGGKSVDLGVEPRMDVLGDPVVDLSA